MVDKILDSTVGALNTSMNLRLMNQNVISSNIANADTPGYKAKAVDFETSLRDALNNHSELRPAGNDPHHLQTQDVDPVHPEIFEDPNGVESLDGNTVDRASEMAKLSENQLLYDASAEVLKRKLGMLKYAISEGGGNH
jgi:flagellar basal-body rod protein FlgB